MRLCFPNFSFSSHLRPNLLLSCLSSGLSPSGLSPPGLSPLGLSPVTCHLPLLSLVTSHNTLLPQTSSSHFFSSSLLLLSAPHSYCTILSIQSLIFILIKFLLIVKMATPGRPQFFCTRPDGTLTPLVAVDELPTNVTIRGVSRTLNAGETQGMTSCGLANRRPEPWSVDGVTRSSERDGDKKESVPDMHSLLLQVLTNKNVPDHMRASAQAILFQGVEGSNRLAGQGTPTNGLSPTAPSFYAKGHHGNKHVWLSLLAWYSASF
jgi:hypothetical protein